MALLEERFVENSPDAVLVELDDVMAEERTILKYQLSENLAGGVIGPRLQKCSLRIKRILDKAVLIRPGDLENYRENYSHDTDYPSF